MKVFLFVFVIFFAGSRKLYSQTADSIPGMKEKIPTTQGIDSGMEYFPPPTRIVFKPKATVPDSLLPLLTDVKVIVRAIVDSSGRPISARILHSTDRRFNNVAKDLALRYRIDAKGALKMYKTKSFEVIIPIVFKRTD